jgi:flagellar biosynthesis protein FlhG
LKARTTIIPIASGKGGVGKSFLTANLGVVLAEMGHTTVVVDMDLGGSNLHFFLGLPNRFPGIGDFLKARSAKLEDLLVSTETPNLMFLPGDGFSPFMANIPYAQKIRLISHMVRLPAEYILLDLGAGTSFNTLDFFRLSPHGFVVTTPEYPAIMNMLVFLKNLILRVIEGNITRNKYLCDTLNSFYNQPMTAEGKTIEELRSRIDAIDGEAGRTIAALCHKYRPRIVFNMGEHPDEIKIAAQINKSLEDSLSINADYFGFIFHDMAIGQSVKKRTVFMTSYRDSMAAENIKRIADRIVQYWDRHVTNSAQLLLNKTRQVFDSHG